MGLLRESEDDAPVDTKVQRLKARAGESLVRGTEPWKEI